MAPRVDVAAAAAGRDGVGARVGGRLGERGVELGGVVCGAGLDAGGRERLDLARAREEHPAVFRVRAVVEEEQRGLVDVEDLALAELREGPLDFLDHVADVHLVTVVVERDGAGGVAAHADLVRAHRDHLVVLVEHAERLALDLEDDAGGLCVELDEVVQLVAADHVDARADLGGLADVLGEDGDLLERQVGQERRDAVLDLDDETRLVRVLAREHLDVVARAERLAHALRGHLDRLPAERAAADVDHDDLAVERRNDARNARLLALKHLDVVARLQRRLEPALRRVREQAEVDVRRRAVLGVRLAGEAQHLVERRIDVVHRERRHLEVLLEVAVAVRLAAKHPRAAALRRQVVRVRALHLLGTEQALRRAEAERGQRRIHGLLALAPRAVRVRLVLARVQVDARHELHADLLAVLRDVEHLREVPGVLAAFDPHPAADGHLGVLLLQLEQVGHLEDRHEERLRVRHVRAREALERVPHVVRAARLDKQLPLERVAAERRVDAQRPPLGLVRQRAAHDGRDELPLAPALAPDAPQAGVVDARHQQALRHLGVVRLRRIPRVARVALAQLLGERLGAHLLLLAAEAVEALVVGGGLHLRLARLVEEVVGDEAVFAQELLGLFVVDVLVVVVDLGLDIEEAVAALALGAAVVVVVVVFVFVVVVVFVFVVFVVFGLLVVVTAVFALLIFAAAALTGVLAAGRVAVARLGVVTGGAVGRLLGCVGARVARAVRGAGADVARLVLFLGHHLFVSALARVVVRRVRRGCARLVVRRVHGVVQTDERRRV